MARRSSVRKRRVNHKQHECKLVTGHVMVVVNKKTEQARCIHCDKSNGV